ncbi:hypothetical protein HG530_011607 [Fusarium avenaceum]|nr:hypothetical protein HG530_011607 [Fusarium avenaceum]
MVCNHEERRRVLGLDQSGRHQGAGGNVKASFGFDHNVLGLFPSVVLGGSERERALDIHSHPLCPVAFREYLFETGAEHRMTTNQLQKSRLKHSVRCRASQLEEHALVVVVLPLGKLREMEFLDGCKGEGVKIVNVVGLCCISVDGRTAELLGLGCHFDDIGALEDISHRQGDASSAAEGHDLHSSDRVTSHADKGAAKGYLS